MSNPTDHADSNHAAGTDFAVHRSMALTREEFLRTLPAALSHDEVFSISGDTVSIQRRSGGCVEITLQTATVRRLGSLRLPVLEVTSVFRGYDSAARAAFLERFNRAFQRGGG